MIRTASVLSTASDVADGEVDLTSLEVHQSFPAFLYRMVGTRFSWWVYLVGATGRERFGAKYWYLKPFHNNRERETELPHRFPSTS